MATEYLGRVPKAGDRVGAKGHTGVFEVVRVDSKIRTVDIGLANGMGLLVPNVPWTALVFVDDE